MKHGPNLIGTQYNERYWGLAIIQYTFRLQKCHNKHMNPKYLVVRLMPCVHPFSSS